VRTLSVFIFILFFFLAGFAFLLAYRLSRHHRHSYLQTYTLHLAFWNGHALVMIMQYILGSVFLPMAALDSLTLVTGPLVILFLALSLYFLVLFVTQLVGRTLTRVFPVFYLLAWGLLLVTFAFTVGRQPLPEPTRFPQIYSLLISVLKVGTVLFSMTFLLFQARISDDRLKRRYLQRIAWTYMGGFILFQLSVLGLIPLYRLPTPNFVIAFFQLGYHFPVLIVLSRFLNHQAVARPPISLQPELEKQLSGLGISPREAEIIGLILRGFNNKEIGDKLFISLETVKKHISNIYRKLGIKNRLQLSYFIQNRLSPPPDEL
jgi:DNA-binding CsgD family transcriptional regulator